MVEHHFWLFFWAHSYFGVKVNSSKMHIEVLFTDNMFLVVAIGICKLYAHYLHCSGYKSLRQINVIISNVYVKIMKNKEYLCAEK